MNADNAVSLAEYRARKRRPALAFPSDDVIEEVCDKLGLTIDWSNVCFDDLTHGVHPVTGEVSLEALIRHALAQQPQDGR